MIPQGVEAHVDATIAKRLHAHAARMHPRCSPKCRGWDVFEINRHEAIEIEACEDCNGLAVDAGYAKLTDDDVCMLPAARRALAARLTAGSRLKGAALRRAREAALREYDLRVALSCVLAWTEHTDAAEVDASEDERALAKIADIARAALGVE